jgi:hypothetical protein
MTNKNGSRVTSESQEQDENSGFLARLADGGFHRVIHGSDLHLAILITFITILIDWKTPFHFISLDFIQNAVPLAISLIAFILVGLSVVVSFSEERFLGLLKDIGIYDTILFNFEYTIYISIATAVSGIVFSTYSTQLIELGVFTESFFLFLFLFTYMVFSVANIVALIVSIGSRKAKLVLK